MTLYTHTIPFISRGSIIINFVILVVDLTGDLSFTVVIRVVSTSTANVPTAC